MPPISNLPMDSPVRHDNYILSHGPRGGKENKKGFARETIPWFDGGYWKAWGPLFRKRVTVFGNLRFCTLCMYTSFVPLCTLVCTINGKGLVTRRKSLFLSTGREKKKKELVSLGVLHVTSIGWCTSSVRCVKRSHGQGLASKSWMIDIWDFQLALV